MPKLFFNSVTMREKLTLEQLHHVLFYSLVLEKLVILFVSLDASQIESPHTITSGLLAHGEHYHD
jgi:hypothetical protein